MSFSDSLEKSTLTRNCPTVVRYKLFIPFQQNNINCIHSHNKKKRNETFIQFYTFINLWYIDMVSQIVDYPFRNVVVVVKGLATTENTYVMF